MKMERIHECLDGEIPRSQLTDEEQQALEELEATLDRSLSFARKTPTPDVRAAVMHRIAQAEAGFEKGTETVGLGDRIRDALAWIWAPRTVRIRPAWALAGLAAVALALGTLPLGSDGPSVSDAPVAAIDAGATPAASSPGSTVVTASSDADADAYAGNEPTVYVRFELDAEGASSVRLAGNFTGWEPEYDLAEIRPGEWSALVPLAPGVHDYAFVVDGERWMADPDAIQVDDGFGGVNSRIALVSPNAGRDAQS